MVGGVRAARLLQERLLACVVRLPMSFFDSQPTGRLLNRMTKDVGEWCTWICEGAGAGKSCALGALLHATHHLHACPCIRCLRLHSQLRGKHPVQLAAVQQATLPIPNSPPRAHFPSPSHPSSLPRRVGGHHAAGQRALLPVLHVQRAVVAGRGGRRIARHAGHAGSLERVLLLPAGEHGCLCVCACGGDLYACCACAVRALGVCGMPSKHL